MNSSLIKTEVGPKGFSYKGIYDLIYNFNPKVENYTEHIKSHKTRYYFGHSH
jgi:hypothetical protein